MERPAGNQTHRPAWQFLSQKTGFERGSGAALIDSLLAEMARQRVVVSQFEKPGKRRP
jgi:hypothetical protein